MAGRRYGIAWAVGWRTVMPLVALSLLSAGCSPRQSTESRGPAPQAPAAPAAPALAPAPQRAVESYLQAAAQSSGQEMYALLAESERKDHEAEDLAKDARKHYPSGATWEVLKTEVNGTVADVIVEFKGADVDPNPYRFTLSQENGAWRITHAPEVEGGGADIKIKL